VCAESKTCIPESECCTTDDCAGTALCSGGSCVCAAAAQYHPKYGCGLLRDAQPGDGESWLEYEDMAIDMRTKLAWSKWFFTDANRFAADCAALTTGGLSGWQPPTVDQVRTLVAGCPDYAVGGACPLSDPTCLSQACGMGANCQSCVGAAGPGKERDYCKIDAPYCFLSSFTRSRCADCATPSVWSYGPINGDFQLDALDEPGSRTASCVTDRVP
jgi:hypothetical protein